MLGLMMGISKDENAAMRSRWRLLLLLPGLAVVVVAAVLVSRRLNSCGPGCVVLLGDSITSRWQNLEQTQISGLNVINRGIPSDVTSHMLERFDRDVSRLSPRVVVIQGGVNDIARAPLSATERNLEAMVEKARERRIPVVLATLLPTGEFEPDAPFPQNAGHREIQTLNEWIKELAGKRNCVVVDYYSALADEQGYFQKGLDTDGVHPSLKGYGRMEPLLREAVEEALRKQ